MISQVCGREGLYLFAAKLALVKRDQDDIKKPRNTGLFFAFGIALFHLGLLIIFNSNS